MMIRTSGRKYELKCWKELPKRVEAQFDYIKSEGRDDYRFVRYKDWWYDTWDMMRATPDVFEDWDGYESDTIFSGVVVKFLDTDYVKMGTYFA